MNSTECLTANRKDEKGKRNRNRNSNRKKINSDWDMCDTSLPNGHFFVG